MSLPVSHLRRKAEAGHQVDDDGERDDATQTHDEQQFKLMNLPRELRNMVYKQALVDPDVITLKADVIVNTVYDHLARIKPRDDNPYRIYDAEPSKFSLCTNLLATSKQVHDEAFLFFYHQPFAFVNSEAVHIFLADMRPTTIGLLKDITILQIRSRGANNNALLLSLCHSTGLTTLRFADRITASDAHLRQKEKAIGFKIASKFYHDAAYFIRRFVAVRGVDDLLGVFKFNEQDLRGDEKTRLQYMYHERGQGQIDEESAYPRGCSEILRDFQARS